MRGECRSGAQCDWLDPSFPRGVKTKTLYKILALALAAWMTVMMVDQIRLWLDSLLIEADCDKEEGCPQQGYGVTGWLCLCFS